MMYIEDICGELWSCNKIDMHKNKIKKTVNAFLYSDKPELEKDEMVVDESVYQIPEQWYRLHNDMLFSGGFLCTFFRQDS